MTFNEAIFATKNNCNVELNGIKYKIISIEHEKVKIIELTDNELFAVPIYVSPESLKLID